ncbi:MAG: hypothetical protein WA667_05960 [Candidatus Nitrosopolaris sp.]
MNAKPALADPMQDGITLSDIAPKWAKRLKEEKKLPFPLSLRWFKWYFELDIPSRCVVGEAHGFSSSYEKECEECNSLGWQFGHSFLVRSRSGLEGDVQNLLQHWNEKHVLKKAIAG